MRIGEIQGVEINLNWDRYSSNRGEGEIVWFVKEHVRYVSLKKVLEGSKVGNILVKEGYSITDVDGFHAELRTLLEKAIKND